jgi:hypothetical protein
MIPAGKQLCRCIGTNYHLAHFAQYCAKRDSAGPSSSTFSKLAAAAGHVSTANRPHPYSNCFTTSRSGITKFHYRKILNPLTPADGRDCYVETAGLPAAFESTDAPCSMGTGENEPYLVISVCVVVVSLTWPIGGGVSDFGSSK